MDGVNLCFLLPPESFLLSRNLSIWHCFSCFEIQKFEIEIVINAFQGFTELFMRSSFAALFIELVIIVRMKISVITKIFNNKFLKILEKLL